MYGEGHEMKPIYEPKGKAKEYGDLAINIYTGCPHRCFYCYAPNVLRRDKEKFHTVVEPRPNIVEEVKKQIEKEHITNKLIHLCFTCDPYPTGYDTTPTREIIKIIKASGNNVQILTKGDGSRDFDLLDENDWYGITYDGTQSVVFAADEIEEAHKRGISTWVSFEPVIQEENVIDFIDYYHDYIDKAKIGKLNYYPSKIAWGDFGKRAVAMCERWDVEYYIKESLMEEMKTN